MVAFQVGIVLIVLAAIYGGAGCIDYEDCGSAFGVDGLAIEGCSGPGACRLHIGERRRLQFGVTAGKNTTTVTNDVNLIVRGQKFPLAVTPEDPCAVIGCPVSTNKHIIYNASVRVHEDFVPIQALLEWRMNDDQMIQVICFRTDVQIVYAPL